MFTDPFGLCPEEMRDKSGSCPGGLSVKEWNSVEAGIGQVRHAGMRARLTRMLNDGKIGAVEEFSGATDAVFAANIYTGSISGSRNFGPAGQSAFDLPAEDIGFALVHEVGHVDQVAGSTASQKNAFQQRRQTDPSFAGFVERGANTGACLLVPNTKLFAPYCK
jgi:hypothetical protein